MRLKHAINQFLQGDASRRRPQNLYRAILPNTARYAILASATSFLFVLTGNQFALSQEQDDDDLKPSNSSSSDSNTKGKSKSADNNEISDDDEPAAMTEPSASSKKPQESRPAIQQFKRKLIDTSIEEKPAAQAASTGEQPESPEYLDRESKLSEPLRKLIQAPHLYDNSKGGSSEIAAAFMAAAKEGAKSRSDLLFIVKNGSPAGKIYAAVLIRMFDPATGTNILNGFKTEKALVNNKSYTAQEHYTTAEVATDLLSDSPSILLKPR